MEKRNFYLVDEAATEILAAAIAKQINTPFIITLSGDLGVGKTTFTRGFLRGLGYNGKVKSPTYTIVEPYQINQHKVYHFDLYRIHNLEELELMGIRDYFADDAIILIEWPENACEILPQVDLSCYIVPMDFGDSGREIKLVAATSKAKIILRKLVWKE